MNRALNEQTEQISVPGRVRS